MSNLITSNMVLYIFLFSILLFTIGAAIINFRARMNEHSTRKQDSIKVISELFSAESDRKFENFFKLYIGRQFDYICVYFLFQSVGKASDGLSLVFSIATLAIVTTQTGVSWGSTIISVLAIAFVTVSIYVAPIKRAKQYLNAWRECDRNIMILFSTDIEKREVTCGEKIMKLDEFVSYCAKSLADGEKNITTDEE